MTVLLSNTYQLEEDGIGLGAVVTGFIGAFEDKEMARNVWKDILKEWGMPDDMIRLHSLDGHLDENTYLKLDENEKYVPSYNTKDAKYLIELMTVVCDVNKVYRR